MLGFNIGYGNWILLGQILSMKVPIETVVKLMLELFGGDEPCNFCDIDEYMLCNAEDYCEKHCCNATTTAEDCWREYLIRKIKELENEKDA